MSGVALGIQGSGGGGEVRGWGRLGDAKMMGK